MSGLTTDRDDPGLKRGYNKKETPQSEVYLVLSEKERARGFVRPVRTSYTHSLCGTMTTMSLAIAETYAREPKFYGFTYCVHCCRHRSVDEFVWVPDGEVVGS